MLLHIRRHKINTLPGRLELPTLRLTASRSNQLSYGSLEDSVAAPSRRILPKNFALCTHIDKRQLAQERYII